MNQLTLDHQRVDVGIDVSRVYERACNSAHMIDKAFPTFVELYEEYVVVYMEEKTNLSSQAIEKSIERLHSGPKWDVEMGFRPEHHGASREAEFLNYLLMNGLVFYDSDMRLINAPSLEVW